MLAISTQANGDIQLDGIQQISQAIQNIPSQDAALSRKARKYNSKCVSPCQVISMMVNSKVGFHTETSQSFIKGWRIFDISKFFKFRPEGFSGVLIPNINLKFSISATGGR